MKKGYLSIILIIALVGLVFTGCSNSNGLVNSAMALTSDIKFQESKEVKSINEIPIIEAADLLGIEIFKEETKKSMSENVIISPTSIFTAFSVLQNGADGETKEQLKKAMNIESLSDGELNQLMNDLINFLNTERVEDSGSTQIFNSLWIDYSLKVKDNYLNIAKKFYNSDIFNANFKDVATKSMMNDWINEKSKGLIVDPIEELGEDLVMTIFNVLYFKGKWLDSFDKEKTKKEDFHLKNGKTIKVDTLNDQRHIDYYEDEKVQVGTLNYYNGKMMIILPKADIDEYLKELDSELIKYYNNNTDNMSAKVKIPKLDIEYKSVINQTLINLGMEDSFDPNKADFSGINEDIPLYIGEVLHDCVVKLDEEGTEAAALTAIMMRTTSMPIIPDIVPEFYVDKPFIFIISDNSSDLILFIGKVEIPS